MGVIHLSVLLAQKRQSQRRRLCNPGFGRRRVIAIRLRRDTRLVIMFADTGLAKVG